jgi:Fic family protein
MEALGFDLQAEATLRTLTADVVKSSAIEDLNADEVRSSIARRLGIDVGGYIPVGRDVDGIVEMMLDATQNYHARLSAERLFGWHAALFPTGRSGLHRIAVGALRPVEAGPMQVVSGPFGRERVHFEAPSADRLDSEMTRFIEWFNAGDDLDPVLKAGLAHLWFVTIHPFEDGNGRIARAIADMALARADRTKNRFYSMSSQIEAERREYYEQLEAQQRGSLDVTTWLSWFLACLDRALSRAEDTLTAVTIKARTWEAINRKPINDRQRTIVNRLLDGFQGNLTTSKYAKITKSSSDTALRDIRELLERGILVQNPGGGRSTSYRLASPEEIPDQTSGRP